MPGLHLAQMTVLGDLALDYFAAADYIYIIISEGNLGNARAPGYDSSRESKGSLTAHGRLFDLPR